VVSETTEQLNNLDFFLNRDYLNSIGCSLEKFVKAEVNDIKLNFFSSLTLGQQSKCCSQSNFGLEPTKRCSVTLSTYCFTNPMQNCFFSDGEESNMLEYSN